MHPMSGTLSDAARAHLIWALTDGVGPKVFGRIVEAFGDAETALGASAAQLQAIKGIGRETADGIARTRDAANADVEIAAAGEFGVRIVSRVDADYPPGLRNIPDPPIVLYVKGELRDTDAVALAIVGSRKCSIYGSEQARRFGELFAQAGFTVVSGLARGVDAFAHHGAVDAGGRSIAVFGNGLNDVYPPENRPLAERLLLHGAWVSELPMRTSVRATNFPGRNRLIAGMTLGTLVVEAAARSGALITARLASEYNRELFALPGRVQDPTSLGTNALIRDGGAKLVTCLDDVLCELGPLGSAIRAGLRPKPTISDGEETGAAPGTLFDAADDGRAADGSAAERALPALATLSRSERRVYDSIDTQPQLQDIVLAAAELPAGDVLAAFTTLELKGLIKRLPGQRVMRRTPQ